MPQVASKGGAGNEYHCNLRDPPPGEEPRRLLLIIRTSTVLLDLFTSLHDSEHINSSSYGRRFSLVRQLNERQGQIPELARTYLVLTWCGKVTKNHPLQNHPTHLYRLRKVRLSRRALRLRLNIAPKCPFLNSSGMHTQTQRIFKTKTSSLTRLLDKL